MLGGVDGRPFQRRGGMLLIGRENRKLVDLELP